MRIQKNWIANISIALYFCGGVYALLNHLSALGAAQADPCLTLGLLTAVLCGVLLAAWIGCTLCAQWRLPLCAKKHPLGAAALEWGLGAAILLGALLVRILYVRQISLPPEGPENIYAEIARLRYSGTLLTEGAAYCDEIALSPRIYGYSGALALAYRLFGVSQWAGQLLNILCGMLSCFFLWRCAALLAGRRAGIIALALFAFWPEPVVSTGLPGPENLASLLLLLCLWMFVRFVRADLSGGAPQIGLVLGHLLLGVMLAIASSVHPAAVVLLAAMLLYLVQGRARLPLRPGNDLPVSARAMARGWVRAAMVLAIYLFASALIFKTIAYQIDRSIPSGEMALFFRQARTQLTSPGALEALLHRFGTLWSGNARGIAGIRLLLEQQGMLTPPRQTLLQTLEFVQMAAYPALLGLSIAAALWLLRSRGTWAYVPVTALVGLALASLFEAQGEAYPFLALPLLLLLTAVLLHGLYEARSDDLARDSEVKARTREIQQEEAAALERIQEAQRYCQELQQQKMEGQFDMLTALREGHVRVSISQAVREDWEKSVEQPEAQPPKQE